MLWRMAIRDGAAGADARVSDTSVARPASPFEPAPRQPLLQQAVPVSRQLRHYRSKAPRDVVAGVTIAALAVPAAMAYAELAGVSAIHGLYALLVPAVAMRRSSPRRSRC